MAQDSPVVIGGVGGVGGSGTRQVARVVTEPGWHLGADLNDALDHLGFTLSFKDERWCAPGRRARNELALDLLSRSLRGQPRLRPWFVRLVAVAAVRMAFTEHNRFGDGRGFWPLVRAAELLAGGGPGPGVRGERLASCFRGSRSVS